MKQAYADLFDVGTCLSLSSVRVLIGGCHVVDLLAVARSTGPYAFTAYGAW